MSTSFEPSFAYVKQIKIGPNATKCVWV